MISDSNQEKQWLKTAQSVTAFGKNDLFGILPIFTISVKLWKIKNFLERLHLQSLILTQAQTLLETGLSIMVFHVLTLSLFHRK